jgi:hypothetical protein
MVKQFINISLPFALSCDFWQLLVGNNVNDRITQKSIT